MKIVIVTPLIPPELGEPAEYVWELATRLAHDHTVTVVAYAHTFVPIPKVRVITVDKHWSLPRRLFACTRTLTTLAKDADILIAQKAGAAGLPAFIASRLHHIPLVVHFPHDEVWERHVRTCDCSEFSACAYKHQSLNTRLIALTQTIVLRGARLIMTQSKIHTDHYRSHFALTHQTVIPLSQPTPPLLSLPLTDTHHPYRIIGIGESGAHLFAQTCNDLQHKIPDLTGVLIKSADTQDAPATIHIPQRIRPSKAEIQYLVTQSGALILFDAHLSHVPYIREYLRMGIPVCTPRHSIVAQLCNPETIHQFDPHDTTSLATLLTTLLANNATKTKTTSLSTEEEWAHHVRDLVQTLTTCV